MNKKLLGALAGVVLAALAGWWLFLRGDDGNKLAPERHARSTLDIPKPVAKQDDAPAPRGMAPRWSIDVDPEGPLQLEGQVVDESGHGVGAAEVWLSSVPPRSAKTEADGTFTFAKLVGREYSLTASTAELVGGPTRIKLTADSDPVVIRLAAGAKLVVAVTGDDGKPIDGAEIKDGEHTARTAGDGSATLKPVHPGWVSVSVTAAGYAPGSAFTQVGSAGATGHIAVTLHKGVSVAGRVIDERGKPIAKAQVTTAAMWDIPSGIAPVETDAKGQFTIPALPPGSHMLAVSDGEHAPAQSSPITVGDRAVTGVEITMKQGGSAAGIVVDDRGTAVPYATVRIAGEGRQMWNVAARQATTDRTGAFEIRGLSRAKLQVRAESDTAASKIVSIDLAQDSARKDLKLVLDVKGAIAGVVVDDAGKPVPETQVNAFPDLMAGESSGGLALAGMSSATTDGAGAFVVRGLPDGTYRLWAARHAIAQREWGEQGTKAKTGDKGVRITLAAPGTLVGSLALESGRAPKLALVSVAMQPSTPANADGTFKLTELTPGKYDLRIHGTEFAELVQHDIEIKPGKTTDLGKLVLARGRKLIGRVVDASGNAVSGAKVRVGDMLFSLQGAEDKMDQFEQMSGGHSDVTDQDGRFAIVGIAKKRTSIMADHVTRGRSQAVEVPEGVDDPPPVTLALRGFGQITGRVTSKGQPISGATITDTPKGGGSQVQIAQSADDGTFAITKAAEGPHVVSAVQPSGFGTSLKSTSITIQVQAGREAKAIIDIPVGTLTLAVQIKPQAGQKVDSAQVFLFRGTTAFHNAKELTDGFLGGSVQGMKFWWGDGKPLPEFDELIAGDFSICSVPITGDLGDSTFRTRLGEHMDALKVYCKAIKLAPSPTKQTAVQELPAMVALPAN